MKRLPHWPWAVVLAAALAVGLWIGGPNSTAKSDRPRVRFWQDSMHPWVKSDHPGTCPICAMDLTPIYEGGTESTNSSVVSLSKDAVTVLNLSTEPVRRRDVTKILRVSGVVEAQESRTAFVSAPAAARVDGLNVDHAGVAVNQGTWLVKLFSPDLAQRTRFLRAATSNRIAGVNTPEPAHPNPQRAGGRTPDMPPETGNVNIPGLRPDLFSSDISSPISGVVTDRSVSLGQFVMEGQRMITIVDPSVVWFRFDASDRQLAWIRAGQQIEVRTDSLPGQRFRGSVSVIEPSVDDARRIGRARAVITNAFQNGVSGAYALRLGSSADGRISVVIPGVLAVPRSAVLYPGSSAWVYLERGSGHYERRRVRLGREGDDGWEVLGGLNEGDAVVVSGNVLLDAQASFEQGGLTSEDEAAQPAQPEPEDSPAPSLAAPSAPLADSSRNAIQSFLLFTDRVAAALAADDFAAFKKVAAETESAARNLTAAATESPIGDWMTTAANASLAARFASARDLKEARAGFLGFGAASAGLAQLARRLGVTPSLRIYQCPMAPKPGLWIQTNAPLANPFFGAAMKRCGDELDTGISIPRWNTGPAAPQQPPVTAPAKSTPLPAASMTNRTPSPASTPTARPTHSTTAHSTNSPHSTHTSTRAGLDHAERLYAAMSGRDELKNQMRARIIAESASTPPPKPEVLTATQIGVLKELLADIDAQGRALATGDLEAFNKGLDRLTRHPSPMLVQLAAPPRWGPEMEGIRVLIAAGPAPNLEQARARFELFAQLSVKLVRDLAKRDAAFQSVRIFSAPGGDRPREWIQLSEPAANPFATATPKNAERTP